MTLTKQQLQMMPHIINKTADYVIKGMNYEDALRQAFVDVIDFCGEMAENRSERAKSVNGAIFARYMDNYYGQQLSKIA